MVVRSRSIVDTAAILVVLVVALCLCGCSSNTPEIPTEITEAEQLKDLDTLSIDSTEATLYRRAKELYTAELYNESQEVFEYLRDGYPFGPYGEFAEIKIADARFNRGGYTDAAVLYEEFVKQHPGSAALPYALLRAGRSYQLANKGIGRNVGPLEKAVEFYEKLIATYPTSPYTHTATQYRDQTAALLIKYNMMVANFYNRFGHEKASEHRVAKLEQRWSRSKIVEVTSEQPASLESLPAVQPVTERGVSRPQIVLAAAPGTLVYASTDSSPPAMASLNPDFKNHLSSARTTSYTVLKAECSVEGNGAIFYLNRSYDGFPNDGDVLLPKDGKVSFKIEQAKANPTTLSCFAYEDLVINSNGEIIFKGEYSFETIRLANPPRIFLSLIES